MAQGTAKATRGRKVPAVLAQRAPTRHQVIDGAFFVLGAVAAVWLAVILLELGPSLGWGSIVFYILFWAVVAYFFLPRLHRVLTHIYVPNYFIGRTRTSDGLLGDPVNLALNGSAEQLQANMAAAGWTLADPVTVRTSLRIVTSTLRKRSYNEAPVSPLFLFERQQNFAYQQEVAGSPSKRHHVRFWKCPDGWLLPGGRRVEWLAAGTFDTAVGLSLFTLQITHRIDADTDIERDHIIDTLTLANSAIGVEVLEDFAAGYHARNGGGDSIKTDGNLPIVHLADPEGYVPAAADPNPPAPPRPIPVVLGVTLMVFGVLSGIATIVLSLLGMDEILKSATVVLNNSPGSHQLLESVVLGLLGSYGVYLAFYSVLAFFVYRGKNWARLMAMTFSVVGLVSIAAGHFLSGVPITLTTNLYTLSFDILVILALSSTRARSYARKQGLFAVGAPGTP